MYCRLEDFFFFFFFDVKNPQICNTWITENWVLQWFHRHVIRPWTVPNLGMADWTFELWTGSNMGSSDLEFRLETGPIRGLADQELAYSSSRLGLDPNLV